MFCSHCDYNLASLPENRCPECGAAFDPLDPATFHTRPKDSPQRCFWRRVSSPWLVLPAVWITYLEFVSGFLMIPLIIFGLAGAVVRRRPLAILLLITINPLTFFFARGACDYARGQAQLYASARPVARKGTIDPTYRCQWRYIGTHAGSARRVCCASYNAAVKMAVHAFGPMPGAYAGPYPTRSEIEASLRQAQPVDLDLLAQDRVAFEKQTIALETGSGEKLVKQSIWSRTWTEHKPVVASPTAPPVMASLTPDGCLVIRIPQREPDAVSIHFLTIVIDPQTGRPFILYTE